MKHPDFQIDTAFIYLKPPRLTWTRYRRRFQIPMQMLCCSFGGKWHRRTPLKPGNCGVSGSVTMKVRRVLKVGAVTAAPRSSSIIMRVSRLLSVESGAVVAHGGDTAIVRRLIFRVRGGTFVHQASARILRFYRFALKAGGVSLVGAPRRSLHRFKIGGVHVAYAGGPVSDGLGAETYAVMRMPKVSRTLCATSDAATIPAGKRMPGRVGPVVAFPVAYRGNNWGEVISAHLTVTASNQARGFRMHLFQIDPNSGGDGGGDGGANFARDGYVGTIEFGSIPAMSSDDSQCFTAECSVGFDFRDRNTKKKLYGILESCSVYISEHDESFYASLDVVL